MPDRDPKSIFNNDEAIRVMNIWIKASGQTDYLNRLKHIQNWIAISAHFIAIITSFLVIWLAELSLSHVGAAIVFSSTLVTGIFFVLTNGWRAKIEALNYGFGAVHPQRLLNRFNDEGDEEKGNRLGLEWFQYKFKFLHDRFIQGLISVEVFIASGGTLIWGFGDVWASGPLDLPF